MRYNYKTILSSIISTFHDREKDPLMFILWEDGTPYIMYSIYSMAYNKMVGVISFNDEGITFTPNCHEITFETDDDCDNVECYRVPTIFGTPEEAYKVTEAIEVYSSMLRTHSDVESMLDRPF